MNSLRVRLVLGFILVALLPLALAVWWFGQRMQRSVHEQADMRLATTLVDVRSRLLEQSTRLASRLEVLARDPQFKRLYLVESASDVELREYLARQRALLGIDYLGVLDVHGDPVADAALATGSAVQMPKDRGSRTVALRPRADAAGFLLDASAEIRYRDEAVGRVRGGLVVDSTALMALRPSPDVELRLADPAAHAEVSTWRGARLPAAEESRATRVTIDGRPYLARSAAVAIATVPEARLIAYVSTAGADEATSALRSTALLLALAGIVLAVLLALLVSRQISRPVEKLAEFSEQISRGEWDRPLTLESVREVQTLVGALERMRGELGEYRERLEAGARQAAYGQMARQVAHEIKNPLTPIAISVADLKSSFEQKREDFPQVLAQATRTIDEEIHRLKTLLREFSDFGRFPSPQLAPVRVAELLADVRALHAHDAEAGRLQVTAAADGAIVKADRAQLHQALINLVQNGLDAIAAGGRVDLAVSRVGDAVEITVADDGPGLSDEQKARLFVPGFTTKAHGSGIGLAVVERIVSEHRGTLTVESSAGQGATFRIRLPAERGA